MHIPLINRAFRSLLENGSDQLIVTLHKYTIYISFCTKTADRTIFEEYIVDK